MTTQDDDRLDFDLAGALRRGPEAAAAVPPFDEVFHAAEARWLGRRRARMAAVGLAAAAAAVAWVLFIEAPQDAAVYIDIDDLMATTSWSAPSDALLPQHTIDLYRDLPDLPESTKPAEGALL